VYKLVSGVQIHSVLLPLVNYWRKVGFIQP